MPTAEELGLTGAVATNQGSTSQGPDKEKLPDEPEAVVEVAEDDLSTDDGYTGTKSFAADEPLDGPAHNLEGHRNVVADLTGNVTVLDDDTARVLYENPKFYTEVFHNGGSFPVDHLTWANTKGNTVSAEKVGEGYELGK